MSQLTFRSYNSNFYFPGTLVDGSPGYKLRGTLRKYRNVDTNNIPYGRLLAKAPTLGTKLPDSAENTLIGVSIIDDFQFSPGILGDFSAGYPPQSFVTVYEKGFYAVAVEIADNFDVNSSFDSVYFGYTGDNKGKVTNVAGAGYAEIPNAKWSSQLASKLEISANQINSAPIDIPQSLDEFISEENLNINLVSPISLDEQTNNSTELKISLNQRPTSEVDVTITSDDPTLVEVSGGASDTLTFDPGNYATPQIVTLEIPDSATTDGTANISIDTTSTDTNWDSLPIADIVVNVVAYGVIITPSSLTINENQSDVLNVSLSDAPSADVTITFTSNDLAIATISGSPLVFNAGNFSVPQQVTVNALEVTGDSNTTITVDVTSSDPLWNT